jgi:hypothetical protein
MSYTFGDPNLREKQLTDSMERFRGEALSLLSNLGLDVTTKDGRAQYQAIESLLTICEITVMNINEIASRLRPQGGLE